MTTPNEIKPATPAEGLDGGRCAVDAGFGVCVACGTKLILSDGWTPSYNDPDNAGLAPMAEPFCPKCEAESLQQGHAAQLEEDKRAESAERMASVQPLLSPNSASEPRLKAVGSDGSFDGPASDSK